MCWREMNDIPHGQQYEKCVAVHAEMNAIINGNRSDMEGATLYLVGFENKKPIVGSEPCEMCHRVIKNAGILEVIS
jgi:dCMP deaminase